MINVTFDNGSRNPEETKWSNNLRSILQKFGAKVISLPLKYSLWLKTSFAMTNFQTISSEYNIILERKRNSVISKNCGLNITLFHLRVRLHFSAILLVREIKKKGILFEFMNFYLIIATKM